MKKIYILLLIIFYYNNNVFAQDGGITGLDGGKLRTGDIHIGDIPTALVNVINFGMGIAGTIAVLFVIIGAYRILFGALSQDATKGKQTIIMAITGFVIAILSWFIVRIVIDNL